MCGATRGTLLVAVHAQVGPTSQFIVLHGTLVDHAPLALDVETRRFHDGAGPLVDCDVSPRGVWGAWRHEAAFTAFDSAGRGGVQWETLAGAGGCGEDVLAGVAAGNGDGAAGVILRANGAAGLACAFGGDSVALLAQAQGDGNEPLAVGRADPAVMGTPLARGADDLAALRKAVMTVRRLVPTDTLSEIDVAVAAGGCPAAVCRRALANKARSIPNDVARYVCTWDSMGPWAGMGWAAADMGAGVRGAGTWTTLSWRWCMRWRRWRPPRPGRQTRRPALGLGLGAQPSQLRRRI
jgi:hypothetical protein